MSQLTIQQAFDLAVQHHRAGGLREAEQLYRQILALQPEHADALHHLGLVAHRTGQIVSAVDLIRRAIALNPNLFGAHNNLGNALRDMGRLHEAMAAYQQAIALRPDYAAPYNNLGNTLKGIGQLEQAIAAYRQAIALEPNLPETHNNLGAALKEQGLLDESIAASRQAIALRPDFPEAHHNLANALSEKGMLRESIAAARQAIALKPDYPEAHNNLGVALRGEGRLDESIAAYREAIALRPDFPEAHHNLAVDLLSRGDFQEGWKEYEWRWRCKDFPSARWNYPQPQWDGSDLTDRTILLHSEQGLGDTIQFIRYVPLVAERGGRVIFRGEAQLRRLLHGTPGIEKWFVPGEALPQFDVHCPLLSLPLAFQTTLESIPAKVPYLSSDPTLGESWRSRLAAYPPAFKVALVWAGNLRNKNDRQRSMKLTDLAPLTSLPGVRFFSLQKGEAAVPAGALPEGTELIDWTGELNDFAETAALIDNLDLVISVDTAVAHLAGAMGKPAWLLLPFAPDWRWMEAREAKAEGGRRKVEEGRRRGAKIESPPFGRPPSAFRLSSSAWYPTMRLFRQPAAGDWASVIAEVANALPQQIESSMSDPGKTGHA
jgi:tetratricopeptide (TPR) repeat protein